MEATDQGVATNSHVEGSPVVESGEQFTAYVNPLVQQSPTTDTSFHSPMEGHTDSPVETEYGPNAPFWRTSMGQAIFEFGVIRPYFENPPLNEDAYRRIQASLDRARNFQGRMDMVMATYCNLSDH